MNKNLPEEYRGSLNAIFTRRAYEAMNNVHNKIFFNEVNKTYTIPNREDNIITALTKQNLNKVTLLQITREILEKAEKEQPEKKLDFVKQHQDRISTEKKKE